MPCGSPSVALESVSSLVVPAALEAQAAPPVDVDGVPCWTRILHSWRCERGVPGADFRDPSFQFPQCSPNSSRWSSIQRAAGG